MPSSTQLRPTRAFARMRSALAPTLALVLPAVLASVLASALPAALRAQATPVAPLTLGDAARIAARQSAAAEVARARVRGAEARVTQQRAALLPAISAIAQEGSRTFNTATFGLEFPSSPGQPPLFDPAGEVAGPNYVLDLRGRVTQELLDLGALGRIRSARAAREASAAGATSASEDAGAAAAAAYLRALRAEAQLGARIADSVLADSLLGIARSQLAAGVGVGLDVTRAQAQSAGVRAQLIAARNERDRTRIALLRALGLPLDSPVTLADSLSAPPSVGTVPPVDSAVAVAFRERADLRAAALELRAAEQQVAAIRGERLPIIGLTADYGAVSGRNDRLASPSRLLPTYTWGIQLSLPLFDGFRREGRMQEQRALASELTTRRDDLTRQVEADVRVALLDLAAAREQVGAAAERARLAELEVSQARERFAAGVSGNADAITASLALNSARTLLVDARTAYQTARLALARAEGLVLQLP